MVLESRNALAHHALGGLLMKIQGRKGFSVGSSGPVNVPGQASMDQAEQAGPVAGDTIEISSKSREVGGLKEAVAAVPEIRSEKIEGIRDQVEEGSYHVESEVLAKRVVDEAVGDALRRELGTDDRPAD